jgi:alpha-galactosidase
MSSRARLLLALSATVSTSLNNGVVLPPIGWSTWNTLRDNFTEAALHDIANAMVASGMVASGYSYFNIDEGCVRAFVRVCAVTHSTPRRRWSTFARDAQGDLVVDTAKLPDGMPALAAFLAARGMKLGIYTAHCAMTCMLHPGSWLHEAQDAALFASWPAAFVKSDNCAWRAQHPGCNDTQAFIAMRDALNATGKPFVYSVHWGNSVYPFRTLATVANMWRVAVDMQATWASVLRLVDASAPLGGYAGAGAFNDMDMLEVGNGMTLSEDTAHFSMWAMLASPLIAGNDPRTMTPDTVRILTNAFVLAVDQDPLLAPARVVQQSNDCEPPGGVCSWQAWQRPLADGSAAVALLNRASNNSVAFAVPFDLMDGVPATVSAYDLWANGALVGSFTDILTANVAPHSVAMWRLK